MIIVIVIAVLITVQSEQETIEKQPAKEDAINKTIERQPAKEDAIEKKIKIQKVLRTSEVMASKIIFCAEINFGHDMIPSFNMFFLLLNEMTISHTPNFLTL